MIHLLHSPAQTHRCFEELLCSLHCSRRPAWEAARALAASSAPVASQARTGAIALCARKASWEVPGRQAASGVAACTLEAGIALAASKGSRRESRLQIAFVESAAAGTCTGVSVASGVARGCTLKVGATNRTDGTHPRPTWKILQFA